MTPNEVQCSVHVCRIPVCFVRKRAHLRYTYVAEQNPEPDDYFVDPDTFVLHLTVRSAPRGFQEGALQSERRIVLGQYTGDPADWDAPDWTMLLAGKAVVFQENATVVANLIQRTGPCADLTTVRRQHTPSAPAFTDSCIVRPGTRGFARCSATGRLIDGRARSVAHDVEPQAGSARRSHGGRVGEAAATVEHMSTGEGTCGLMEEYSTIARYALAGGPISQEASRERRTGHSSRAGELHGKRVAEPVGTQCQR